MKEVIVNGLKNASDILGDLYERKCADPKIGAAANAFSLIAELLEQIEPDDYNNDSEKFGEYLVEQVLNDYPDIDTSEDNVPKCEVNLKGEQINAVEFD